MTLPTLEKGKALIITGPAGCGKTRLALQLAQEHGTVRQTGPSIFRRLSSLSIKDLARGADVIIIDGLPEDSDTKDEVLSMLKHALTTPGAPMLIFTDYTAGPEYRRSRRFVVYDMKPRGAK